MPAFRIFDPYAFLNAKNREAPTEKAAKGCNPEPEPTRGLAGLATLAGLPTGDCISPGADGENSEDSRISAGAALENSEQTVAAAKVAKVAKDKWSATADQASECDFKVAHQDCGNTPPPEPQLISPASWFERCTPPTLGEPPYDRPCPVRRGRVERRGAALLHFCVSCGAWGAFGYGVFGDRPGRCYCFEHRPSG